MRCLFINLLHRKYFPAEEILIVKSWQRSLDFRKNEIYNGFLTRQISRLIELLFKSETRKVEVIHQILRFFNSQK